MRKSAHAYARAGVSRTGVLNTKILHQYKYNEDLFKKVTTLPDGKNHGMIFVLDWSGSMNHNLLDTVKQVCSLAWSVVRFRFHSRYLLSLTTECLGEEDRSLWMRRSVT